MTEPTPAMQPACRLHTALLLVGLGGVIGSLARYALVSASPDLPATLAINVAGSFLLGLLVGRTAETHWTRPFMGSGVLGGFTTFSALAVQTIDATATTAIAYVAATLLLGIGAARAGLAWS